MEKSFMEDKNKLSIIRLWFKKAESDFKTIENNLRSDDPPTDAICFHAQQAIEKYMKGSLIYFGESITKTHDLVNLLTLLVRYIPKLNELEEILDEISHYGVEVRYPDVFYDPTMEEAQKASHIANKVKTIILEKVKV